MHQLSGFYPLSSYHHHEIALSSPPALLIYVKKFTWTAGPTSTRSAVPSDPTPLEPICMSPPESSLLVSLLYFQVCWPSSYLNIYFCKMPCGRILRDKEAANHTRSSMSGDGVTDAQWPITGRPGSDVTGHWSRWASVTDIVICRPENWQYFMWLFTANSIPDVTGNWCYVTKPWDQSSYIYICMIRTMQSEDYLYFYYWTDKATSRCSKEEKF